MAEKHTSFIKQGAILAAAGILSRVLGFFLRIVLTNVIGDRGNGIYGDGYTIYNFFFILSSAGLPVALSKIIAGRLAENKRAEAYFIFRVALKYAAVAGLLCSFILAFFARDFARLINNPQSYYTILALSPTIAVVSVLAVFRGYFQGFENTVPTALSQTVEQIGNVIASVALMFVFMSIPFENGFFSDDKIVMGAAGGQLGTFFGAIAGLFAIFLLYRKLSPAFLRTFRRVPKQKSGFSTTAALKEIMAVCVPIIAGTAVFSLSNLVDAAMVKWRLAAAGFSVDEAVALYGAYNGKFITLTTLPLAISAALATSLIPSVAQSLAKNDHRAVRVKIHAAFRTAILVTTPAAMGLGVLATPIYRFIFRNAPGGAMMLSIGAVSIIFLTLSQIAAGALQGAGALKIPVIAAGAGVLVKIPLNFILCAVPAINIYGAIISTIACYVVSSLVNIYFLKRLFRAKLRIMNILARPLTASAVMGMGAYIVYATTFLLTRVNFLAVILAVFSGVVFYCVFMLLLDGFTKGEIENIKNRLKKIKSKL
ncbi:stage V sporulation protein B [Clostridia bacterium]|nr:stage V sporulation protein B [Clostridia bacterium]